MDNKAYIQYIEYYLPDGILNNTMISEKHPEWSIDKIAKKTGILSRHIAGADETAGDMAVKAIERLLENHQIDKSKIDYLLFCTQSSDYFLPSTACIIQDKIGLSTNCGAFDYNLGCSGYIYGLGLAKGLILSGQASNIILVTSDTYSKYINDNDKSNKTLFGDAATATLINNQLLESGINGEILNFQYGTDGSGSQNLIVKNGGSRHPDRDGVDVIDENGNTTNEDNLFMDGKAIFNFTASSIPLLTTNALEKNNLSMDDIDLVIFHQANEYMLNVVRSRCAIPKEKFYVNFSDCGNTVSSTIPIAFFRAIKDNCIKPHDKILLAGFGVGLSMGATIINIHE